MGSATFFHVVVGHKDDLDGAYKSAVDDARREFGDNPYNGTISTTNGVRLAHPTPMTEQAAMDKADDLIDAYTKWESAGAIPLVKSIPAVRGEATRTTVTVTVKGDADHDTVKATFAKALKVRPGDITDITTLVRKPTYISRAVAPKEKSETRYFIMRPDGRMPVWEAGHATQSEARAAAMIQPNPSVFERRWGSIDHVTAEIVGITRRVTGEPLVTVTHTPKTIEVTADVKTAKITTPAKATTEHYGWLIFGWAAE